MFFVCSIRWFEFEQVEDWHVERVWHRRRHVGDRAIIESTQKTFNVVSRDRCSCMC
jgi:hypothetical protein